ncbi:MAG: hypothetical protein MZU97_10400 [Bacillus subtilis]|nr:hypothetical protein [Bacillus subtilis]
MLLFVTAMFDKGRSSIPSTASTTRPTIPRRSSSRSSATASTFVWSFVFLGVLIFTYVTGERYVSALYFLAFVGILPHLLLSRRCTSRRTSK